MNTFFKQFMNTIKSYFLNGLLVLLPITLTAALFTIVFRVIILWLAPLRYYTPELLSRMPYGELILVIMVIFVTGLVVKLFFLHPLIQWIESVFFKFPLMRPVYGGIKQLVSAFTLQGELAFQKVVYVNFPTDKSYCLGFLTGQVPQAVGPADDDIYYNVFIPTTPNPTSGFLVQVPQKSVKVVDLTRQEAMSIIISGGIIQPDRFE